MKLGKTYDRLAAFDAFQYLDTLSPRPLLLIVGSKADTLYFSEDAMQRAKEPKELYVIEINVRAIPLSLDDGSSGLNVIM